MMKQMGLLDDAVARLQEAVRRDPERAAAFLARRQPEKGSNE
jgi:hypothetical protein